MKARLAATCVALGLAFAPLAGFAGDKDTPKKDGVVGKAKEAIEDTAITAKIKTEFAKDKLVSAMKIHVDTHKGVVKLTGTAQSKAEADKAAAIAKNAHGVTSVQNEIQVAAAGKK